MPKPKKHTKMVPYCFIIIMNSVRCNGQTHQQLWQWIESDLLCRDLSSDFSVSIALPSELGTTASYIPAFLAARDGGMLPLTLNF